jgi:hypothetical protein
MEKGAIMAEEKTEVKVQEEVAEEANSEKPGKIARAKAWVGRHKIGILTGAAAAAAGAVALGVKGKIAGKFGGDPTATPFDEPGDGGGAEI